MFDLSLLTICHLTYDFLSYVSVDLLLHAPASVGSQSVSVWLLT